ncbi:sulfurtransferase [Roseomonas marmotae]|uniref:Sulfurtransferase n=1 Tax=Roseomonas marmotae TaxID=2768161 RepID=A0ABS3K935_9PROT|nr:rhodanese-like domain-containing protein [Roseomonas marmotae]MBO1073973.1 sulfurtransferase [Roseomonas marmotae]QTI78765.1 sulfurtransferase [Roseomonas marmotae]
MQELVSAEWLKGELGKPDLVVFDATYYLPNEPQDAQALFLEAHIPGARFFDVNEVADPETNLPHMAPTAGRAARLLGQLGIANSSRVVFYDQKGLFSAARGWWLLRLFGHERVAVLDGGLPKWRTEGGELAHGAASAPRAQTFWADFIAARLAGIGDVKRAVASRSAQIIDARSPGRFDGTAPEPRPGLPSGHMPGACNVPATALLAPDQTMLPPEVLRELFARAGVDGSKPTITSCGTGITACVVALGLVRAGLPEPAVYDGSWTEWAARPETPKEKSA